MARAVNGALLPALCVALLALPASALGSVKCAPPGVAGVSEYFETLPGLSCNVPSPRPGHGGAARRRGNSERSGASQPTTQNSGSGQTQGGSLPAPTSQQLSRRGPAGQAVRRLVAQTGTAPRRRARTSRGAVSAETTISGAGRGAIGGLLHPLLSGSARGGAGALLPLFLGAALVIALALWIWRRRRRTGP